MKKKLVLKWFFITFFLLFLIQIALTLTSFFYLKRHNFKKAMSFSQLALPLTQLSSTLTFQQIPDLEISKNILLQIKLLQKISLTTNLEKTHHYLKIFEEQNQALLKNFHKDSLIKRYLQKRYPCFLIRYQDFNDFLIKFFYHDSKILILLQNSQELRSTGGFLGSYAILKTSSAGFELSQIYDIYDQDGQFTSYKAPYAGQKQYLSEGRGLRLPDANWQADFGKVTTDIASFFPDENFDYYLAVNSIVIEKILEQIGPIYLPDLKTNLSIENFTDLSQIHRDNFFPGSRQKVNFLENLSTNLILKLTKLNETEKFELLENIFELIKQKQILLAASNQETNSILSKYRLNGTLGPSNQSNNEVNNFIYLIESNVGINKANQKISRTISLDLDDNLMKISINLINKNPILADRSNDHHLAYVNYQRLITQVNNEIVAIYVNGQKINSFDQDLITNSQNQQFWEIGFLTNTLEQTETKVEILVKYQQNFLQNSQIFIQKQSGLEPVPYEVNYHGQKISFTLDQDKLIDLTTLSSYNTIWQCK